VAPFALFLFSTDSARVQQSVAAGVAGVVVDWEHVGKERRQAHADTQINRDGPEELRCVRAATDAVVVCRINSVGAHTAAEIEAALGAGADELLVPMVRSEREVETVLDAVAGRCGVGILVETVDAVERAAALARLPLARVYVGLHDLAIERGTPNLFAAVADGTVERVRAEFDDVPFGFGGLTVPERGAPIPCRLLIGEMARLHCDFSFLRRSFHADSNDARADVPRILAHLAGAFRRTAAQVALDHDDLLAAIAAWSPLWRQPA
jgi:hypothetical protein